MTFKKFISVLCAVSVFAVSAISVSAASNYTPSVTKKDSVTISVAVDKDGNTISEFELIVTPISNPSDAPTTDAVEQLNTAFEEIKNADSLEELPIVGTNPFDGKTEEYVVANLFDVSFKGTTAEEYFNSYGEVTVTFTIGDLSTDVDSIWLHRYSTDEKWHAMDVTKSGTNSYTTTFTTLSPVAICVPASSSAGTVVSPQTGDTTNYWFYLIVAACIPAFVGAVVLSRKKLAA